MKAKSLGSASTTKIKSNPICLPKVASGKFQKTLSFENLPEDDHSRGRALIFGAHSDGSRGGGGGDFLAGFLVGGALFGTLAYVFAPQIRRSLLNEDDSGFRRTKRLVYYSDDGLEKTRQTLNAKINQLNSAIDNVSSRLRGGKSTPASELIETDPEVEATL